MAIRRGGIIVISMSGQGAGPQIVVLRRGGIGASLCKSAACGLGLQLAHGLASVRSILHPN